MRMQRTRCPQGLASRLALSGGTRETVQGWPLSQLICDVYIVPSQLKIIRPAFNDNVSLSHFFRKGGFAISDQ